MGRIIICRNMVETYIVLHRGTNVVSWKYVRVVGEVASFGGSIVDFFH